MTGGAGDDGIASDGIAEPRNLPPSIQKRGQFCEPNKSRSKGPSPHPATVVAMPSPILDIAIRDLAKARSQLDALKEQAVRPELREAWAKTALQLAHTLIVTDVAAARSLLEDVRLVAMAHPGEPLLVRAWADAASTIVPHLAVVDVDAARSLLNTFEEVAQRHPDEPRLMEQRAAGMKAMISRLAITDPARAQALQLKLESIDAPPGAKRER
jgi:hypothetical protein